MNKRKKKIGNQKFFGQSGLVFDLYLGHSQGDIRNFYEGFGSNHFHFKKSYFQFGLHGTIKSFGLQFATRMGKLNYGDGIVQGSQTLPVRNSIEILNSDNDFAFTEHFFRIHAGIKYAQIILSFSRAKKSDTFFKLGVVDHVSSIGLHVDIDDFFRGRKRKK